MNSFPIDQTGDLSPYTTSLYQSFQTSQVTELLNNYGPIFEMWIDIPGILGRGYRTFLYNHIASLQPDTVIMMNSGFGDGTNYNVDFKFHAPYNTVVECIVKNGKIEHLNVTPEEREADIIFNSNITK